MSQLLLLLFSFYFVGLSGGKEKYFGCWKSFCHKDYLNFAVHCRIANGFWPFIISVMRLRTHWLVLEFSFYSPKVFFLHIELYCWCAEHTHISDERFGAASHEIYIHLRNWIAEKAKIILEQFFPRTIGRRSLQTYYVFIRCWFFFTFGVSFRNLHELISGSGPSSAPALCAQYDYESIRMMMSVQSNRYIIVSTWSVTLSHYGSFSRNHIHETADTGADYTAS